MNGPEAIQGHLAERSAARLAHQSGGLGVASSNLAAPTRFPQQKQFQNGAHVRSKHHPFANRLQISFSQSFSDQAVPVMTAPFLTPRDWLSLELFDNELVPASKLAEATGMIGKKFIDCTARPLIGRQVRIVPVVVPDDDPAGLDQWP